VNQGTTRSVTFVLMSVRVTVEDLICRFAIQSSVAKILLLIGYVDAFPSTRGSHMRTVHLWIRQRLNHITTELPQESDSHQAGSTSAAHGYSGRQHYHPTLRQSARMVSRSVSRRTRRHWSIACSGRHIADPVPGRCLGWYLAERMGSTDPPLG
jgi:hypothetical protein